jgi:DNA-binding transcriptional LysR family regulator
MAVEMASSESPKTIIEDGFDLAIHSGDLPDSNLVARKFAQTMIILVATPQYVMRYGMPESPEDLRRFPAVVFVERGSAQSWSIGSGQNAKRIILTGVFRTSDIEQMRMGVLEHLGIAQAPAWLFAAERRVNNSRALTSNIGSGRVHLSSLQISLALYAKREPSERAKAGSIGH